MQVSVPIARGAGYFDDKGPSANSAFPEGARAELPESLGEFFKHRGEVWLVLNPKAEVLKTFAFLQLDGGYKEFKTFAHPTAATN